MINPYDVSLEVPMNVRTVAFIVLDSLRCDTFEAAARPNLDALCPHRYQRNAYATWTQPSHTCLLSGLLPYESVPGTLASQIYTRDLSFWASLLAGDVSARAGFMPTFSLALFARAHGWHTLAQVAMPVLNPDAGFARGFDSYGLLPSAANFGAQAEEITLELTDAPAFIFINCGDTHYPYRLHGQGLPRISGLNGCFHQPDSAVSFTKQDYRAFRRAQTVAVEMFDHALPDFVSQLAKPAVLIVTSDHGELFGEGGYFGHGPFNHPLLTRVPLAMGLVT